MKQCNMPLREWFTNIDCDIAPIYANDEECKDCEWYQENKTK